MNTEKQDAAVRPLERRDLGALSSLLEELTESAHTNLTFPVERLEPMFEAMAARPDEYVNLVAESKGDVAGFISVVFYRSFFHRVGTALINELVVSRAHRRQGIGSLLIRVAAAHTLAALRAMAAPSRSPSARGDSSGQLPSGAGVQTAGRPPS